MSQKKAWEDQFKTREWRQRKRAEMKAVERAVDKFLFGAAYTPISKDYSDFFSKVKEFRSKLSVKQWGR